MEQSGTEPKEDETRPGSACYRDQNRICGPDCMAYLPQKPEGTAYIGEQWAHCHLLVNADRVGRHLVVIADTNYKLASIQRKAEAEAIRTKKAPGVG
jgi:hypothetical protein